MEDALLHVACKLCAGIEMHEDDKMAKAFAEVMRLRLVCREWWRGFDPFLANWVYTLYMLGNQFRHEERPACNTAQMLRFAFSHIKTTCEIEVQALRKLVPTLAAKLEPKPEGCERCVVNS